MSRGSVGSAPTPSHHRKSSRAWRGSVVLAACITALGLTASADAQNDKRRLQGQVPLEDQLNGRARQGYRDHMQLVGHNNILDRRNNGNLGWVDDCAYVSAYFGSRNPIDGLAVLDVANPYTPTITQMWPGTPGARESQVEANQETRMVVVMPFPRASIFGDPASESSVLQLYDVPQGNCSQLVKRGEYRFGNATVGDGVGQKVVTHEHRIWKDKIYVTAQSSNDPGPPLYVIDASNRDNPALLATWDLADEGGGAPLAGIHDMDVNPEGTRAYVNISTRTGANNSTEGGLAILDTTEVANWKPGMPAPKIRRISEILYWTPPTPGSTHTTQFLKVNGRKFVAVANEGTGCPAPWFMMVDAEYEKRPVIVSTMQLEVSKRENCAKTLPDHNGLVLGDPGGKDGILMQYRYGAHYVGVDNIENARYLGTTWYSGGLHVWDISDPYAPVVVGSFNPPALEPLVPLPDGRLIPDRTYSFVRFHKGNIWFTSVNGGFWVVRLTGNVEDSDVD
jgi:hypothetical protein